MGSTNLLNIYCGSSGDSGTCLLVYPSSATCCTFSSPFTTSIAFPVPFIASCLHLPRCLCFLGLHWPPGTCAHLLPNLEGNYRELVPLRLEPTQHILNDSCWRLLLWRIGLVYHNGGDLLLELEGRRTKLYQCYQGVDWLLFCKVTKSS